MTAADQKYIVCNADEGDSGTYADRMIMEGDPFVLIEGMTIAGSRSDATEGFIYSVPISRMHSGPCGAPSISLTRPAIWARACG